MINTMKDKSLCGLIKFHSARLAEIAKDTEELQASIDDEVAEAYQQGFEDGKKEAESSDFIENLQANAFNKGMLCKSERIHEAYQRGLNEAWEAARKVVLSPDEGGMSVPDLFAIFGNSSMQNVFRKYSASEAIEKMKAYEEKRKANEEIKVGDFSALIDYLSQFDESDVAKVKYIRQKIEAAIGENIDWYERRKS